MPVIPIVTSDVIVYASFNRVSAAWKCEALVTQQALSSSRLNQPQSVADMF